MNVLSSPVDVKLPTVELVGDAKSCDFDISVTSFMTILLLLLMTVTSTMTL